MIQLEDFIPSATVSVDSGLVMFVDPCYVLTRDGENGETYESLLEHLDNLATPYNPPPTEPWGAGMGTVISTPWGDGTYNVYVRKDNHGKVLQVLIDLEGEFDELYADDLVEPDTYDDEAV